MHNERIDVLRALAIILVFLHHAQICLYPDYRVVEYNAEGTLALTGTVSAVLNFSPAAFGHTGVLLFLIISGFLIHLGTLKAAGNGMPFNAHTFFSKRFWRIYPPYLLTLLFFCFAVQGSRFLLEGPKIWDLLSHAFMVHNLSNTTFGSINPSLWSIALEVQLYLVYPLVLSLRKSTSMRTILIILVALSLGMQALGRLLPSSIGGLAYDMSLFRFWFIWCAGAFLAERYYAGGRLFGGKAGWVSLVLFLCMAFAKYVQWSAPYGVYFAVFAWLAFSEWAIHMYLPARWQGSILFKALIAIGLCSYSIYLVHQPFLRPLLNFFGTYGPIPLALFVKLVVVFGILFLISWALYQWVELPSIGKGARLRAARRA